MTKRFEGLGLRTGSDILVYLGVISIWKKENECYESPGNDKFSFHVKTNGWNPLFWIIYLILIPFFAHSYEKQQDMFEYSSPTNKDKWIKV